MRASAVYIHVCFRCPPTPPGHQEQAKVQLGKTNAVRSDCKRGVAYKSAGDSQNDCITPKFHLIKDDDWSLHPWVLLLINLFSSYTLLASPKITCTGGRDVQVGVEGGGWGVGDGGWCWWEGMAGAEEQSWALKSGSPDPSFFHLLGNVSVLLP